VGDDGAHAELAGEHERLAVTAFRLCGTAGRRDIAGEEERVGLATPGPQPAAERQGLAAVAERLPDPTALLPGVLSGGRA
jgi:hypothetical protein